MKVTIYGKDNCPYCTMAKNLAEKEGAEVRYLSLGEDYEAKTFMAEFPGARTFPQIIVNGKKIGGYQQFEGLLNESN